MLRHSRKSRKINRYELTKCESLSIVCHLEWWVWFLLFWFSSERCWDLGGYFYTLELRYGPNNMLPKYMNSSRQKSKNDVGLWASFRHTVCRPVERVTIQNHSIFSCLGHRGTDLVVFLMDRVVYFSSVDFRGNNAHILHFMCATLAMTHPHNIT